VRGISSEKQGRRKKEEGRRKKEKGRNEEKRGDMKATQWLLKKPVAWLRTHNSESQ
jgi:hypothetical protein